MSAVKGQHYHCMWKCSLLCTSEVFFCVMGHIFTFKTSILLKKDYINLKGSAEIRSHIYLEVQIKRAYYFSLPILRGLAADPGFSKADKRIKHISENTVVVVGKKIKFRAGWWV